MYDSSTLMQGGGKTSLMNRKILKHLVVNNTIQTNLKASKDPRKTMTTSQLETIT